MAKHQILWSTLALTDLQEIRQYVRRDNPLAAKRLAQKIRRSVMRLAEYPQSGRVVPELPHKHYREVIVAPYRIVYAIRRRQIIVLRVWHARRNLEESGPGGT